MALLKHYDLLHSARTADEYASLLPDLTKLEFDVEMANMEKQLESYSYVLEKQKERGGRNLEEIVRVVSTIETKLRLLQDEQAKRLEN